MWKTCGRTVEVLWTACRPKIKISRPVRLSGRVAACGRRFAASFACLPGACAEECTVLPTPLRFNETIGGRVYFIEVSSVGGNRWRAQIVKAPGVPTAMMPFYGPTPSEAAGQLSAWLALAHRTAAAGAPGS